MENLMILSAITSGVCFGIAAVEIIARIITHRINERRKNNALRNL